jgi:hypothetical protein
MRVCGCNTAGVVLTGAAVDQFKSGLERMRSFDPAQCVRELHQRARIEARRRAGAVEWRVISHGRAADRSELLVEQFALQLREGGQSFWEVSAMSVSSAPRTQQPTSNGDQPNQLSRFIPHRASFSSEADTVEVQEAVYTSGNRRISPKNPSGKSGSPFVRLHPSLFPGSSCRSACCACSIDNRHER